MATMSPTVQETASDKTGAMVSAWMQIDAPTTRLHHAQMKEAFEVVKSGKPGDSESRLAWNGISTTEFDDAINEHISFLYHNSLILDSSAIYFDRDNVGLPGVAAYAKSAAVDARNTAWRFIDFNNKRGAAAKIGAIGAPPVEFHAESHSDVLSFFSKALASVKVSYKMISDTFKIAIANGDAHAADFLGTMAKIFSEKIRLLSHHVTHLTLVESDKFAIKQFDRTLTDEVVPFAMATGLESTLPARLVQGAMDRLAYASNSVLNKATFDGDRATTAAAVCAYKNQVM